MLLDVADTMEGISWNTSITGRSSDGGSGWLYSGLLVATQQVVQPPHCNLAVFVQPALEVYVISICMLMLITVLCLIEKWLLTSTWNIEDLKNL